MHNINNAVDPAKKIILITGATDGIGKEAAKTLAKLGHTLLLHGRSQDKLTTLTSELKANCFADIHTYLADISDFNQVIELADAIKADVSTIDVIINNAGVYMTPTQITDDEIDMRFMVNTIAPYYLTKTLQPLLPTTGRVVNLSSAAQASVSILALLGKEHLSDGAAYAQSKLALIMWTFYLAKKQPNGPLFIALNPGSLLASKMVREAYGIEGADLSIGANAIVNCAIANEFANANGKYFDNDTGKFNFPHPDVSNLEFVDKLIDTLDNIIEKGKK